MSNCITTYTKKEFDAFNPDPALIDIKDIAHALSMMTRAGGHFPEFYSVGQHCVLCCREAIARHYVPELALACLLHDGSEAYIADITRPVKQYMTMYLQIENQLQEAIFNRFLGFIPQGEEMQLVKNIDDTCLYYEFMHYMGQSAVEVINPILLAKDNFRVQSMKEVEKEFLELFCQLTEKME